MTNEPAHAILGASSSKRWLTCPGSVAMAKNAPEKPTSIHASEGTAAHELGEKCLLSGKNPKDFKGAKITADGTEFFVDDEMIDAVATYVDFVRELAGDLPIQVETRFRLDWLHPGMFGTNDACIAEDFGDLHVIDYKHGAGVAVEVENNTQLLYYAIGAAYDAELGHWRDFENVHLHVVQPRCPHHNGPIRTWTIPLSYLIEFADVLKRGALATEKPNAPKKAGDHCRWCPAAGFCTEIHRESQSVARAEFGSPLPTVEKLTPEQIGKIIEAKGMIKSFLDRVDEYALHLMAQGKEVPGTKLVRKRSSREWKDEDLVRRSFGSTYPIEKVYNMKLKTVAQMEKSIGKEAVKDYAIKIEGGITIAPLTDRRKAVEMKEIEQ